MTPKEVKIIADNINDFIEVPNSLERLRKAVSVLAISGNLVPQEEKDGTAEKLFEQIKAESSKMDEKSKLFLPITKEEIPFNIPKTWKWVRLGEIVKVKTGSLDANASSPDGEYPFFTCAKEPLKINRFAYDCECVLLAGNGDFNVKYYKGKFEAYQRTYIIEAKSEKIFIPYIYILVQMQTEKYRNSSLGGAMPYIRLGYVTDAVVSLPPYSEQKRIVKKVEEVMVQLDDLEVKKKECNKVRARLVSSTMQSLGKGETKVAFEQLTELIKTATDVKELENALLTLAVSGKLVPQDKKEGTAKDLYNQIKLEQSKNTEGKKRKEKEFVEISQEEIPLKIPDSWKWVRISNIINEISGGGTPSMANPDFWNGDICWASVKDLNVEKYLDSTIDHITEAGLHSKPSLLKKAGSIIVCTRMGLGKIAILMRDMAINQDLKAIVLNKSIDPNFFLIQYRTFNIIGKGVTVSGITQDKLLEILFALPPYNEQKRIVKKVEEIMILINQLREVIGESKNQGRGRPKK